MSFGWEAFLTVAEKLVELQEGEAFYRSAISRAYYAVFHIAKEKIFSLDPYENISQDGKVHQEVIKFYKEKYGHLGIGYSLNMLRDQRNIADYANEKINYEKEARASIGSAKHILSRLSSIN